VNCVDRPLLPLAYSIRGGLGWTSSRVHFDCAGKSPRFTGTGVDIAGGSAAPKRYDALWRISYAVAVGRLRICTLHDITQLVILKPVA